MADLRFRILGTAHRNIYRLTGGKVGGRLGRLPVLLLTTIGRKSGRPRTQPLAYTRAGDGYAVIASKGGAAQHPLWYLNLRANPFAEVTVGRETRKVRARESLPRLRPVCGEDEPADPGRRARAGSEPVARGLGSTARGAGFDLRPR